MLLNGHWIIRTAFDRCVIRHHHTIASGNRADARDQSRRGNDIVIDAVRSEGGEFEKISLEDALPFSPERPDQLVALDEALSRLAGFDPRQARIVELRFFGGLTESETAEVLGVSSRTVKRDWSVAKAWLHGELNK